MTGPSQPLRLSDMLIRACSDFVEADLIANGLPVPARVLTEHAVSGTLGWILDRADVGGFQSVAYKVLAASVEVGLQMDEHRV